MTDDPDALDAWQRFHAMVRKVARRVFPTLTQPLRSRAEMRTLLEDDPAWRTLFEEPLSRALERTFSSDLLRGVVLTDALIGTFAPAEDPLMPRLRDRRAAPELAFAGTFHVNEGSDQLQRAFEEAAAGPVPVLPPSELYGHSPDRPERPQ